jgi:hypothetical protein
MSTQQLTHGTACGNSFYDIAAGDALAKFDNIAQLITAYEYGGLVEDRGAHYYTPATRKFFGTRNAHIVAGTGGAFTVELQTNAPVSVRYSVQAWKLTATGYPVPCGGCAHATLKGARACALATFNALTR